MTGILLVNLGTPDSPSEIDIRKYLREFLMDPYVIDIPFLARWFLVHVLILPKRPKAIAESYKKIWSDLGSPLRYYSLDLEKKVSAKFASIQGGAILVRMAMRYGNPSIQNVLNQMLKAGVDRLIVLPMYPQYSLAANESSIVEVKRAAKSLKPDLPIQVIEDFYDHPAFISAFAEVARSFLVDKKYDHLIFSFHGLPERHVHKTDPTGAHCLNKTDCCERMGVENQKCYRAQCFASARLIASQMGLERSHYSISFQSRLGRTPWIKPYTDVLYDELAKKGVKRLAVVSPSFVADCLETVEEIAIRGREQFIKAGGEELFLVPSLNAEDVWVDAVHQMVTATI